MAVVQGGRGPGANGEELGSGGRASERVRELGQGTAGVGMESGIGWGGILSEQRGPSGARRGVAGLVECGAWPFWKGRSRPAEEVAFS